MSTSHTYIAIDLKSFFASVECRERNLDPLTTNLVVADGSRTEKTICLAVSPSLKSYGISGRARLFEVAQRVKEVNEQRRRLAPERKLTGKTFQDPELKEHPQLALDYIVAPPRMALYMDYSSRVYEVYLKYVAPEDIHVYSIDEVFMDVTHYLKTYQMTVRELTMGIIQDILAVTGITSTAGIGTNLYLCKIALDIGAKHIKPDENGVRIAQLDEMSYRRLLWDHQPITDFWRVGPGYAKKLHQNGLYTMGDVARCSLGGPEDFYNEDLLYKLFGVHAELLIDHAWGYEPCTLKEIKAYRPENNSLCSGQVLQVPYDAKKTRLVVREMADLLSLDLVDKGLVTDQLVLTIGYDIENLTQPERRKAYKGEITTDRYGRQIPKHAHGTTNLGQHSASTRLLLQAVTELFDRIIDESLLVRRVTITANHVVPEASLKEKETYQQLELFTDYKALEEKKKKEKEDLEKERRLQQAMLDIKKKYGKNAILKGMNLEEGATAMDRNSRIGGHKA